MKEQIIRSDIFGVRIAVKIRMSMSMRDFRKQQSIQKIITMVIYKFVLSFR